MKWLNQLGRLDKTSGSEAQRSDVYRVYQAARVHRTFVLRDLLPRHGLVVI